MIIADDSDFVRDGLKIILNLDDEFYVVGCAASGKEAVNLVIKNKTDVILMDIQMPEMSGIEATREIVSRETIKAVNKYEAKEVAEQHKPADADNYNIQDITGNY